MVAAKFFDDQYFNNAYYAKVGGVPCLEMNALETELLFFLNFHLFVTSSEFAMYKNQLLRHAHVSCRTCGKDSYSRTLLSCAREAQPRDGGMCVAQVTPHRGPGVMDGSTIYNYNHPSKTQSSIGGEAPVCRKMAKHHVSDHKKTTNANIPYSGMVHPSGISNTKLRHNGHRHEMYQVA